MNFHISKSIIFSFKLFLILSTLFFSVCKTMLFNQAEIDIFGNVYNSFFCYSEVSRYVTIANDLKRFITYGLEKSEQFKNKPRKLANVYYGKQNVMSQIIDRGCTDSLDIFINYAISGDLNLNRKFDLDGWGGLCYRAGNSVDYDYNDRFDDFNPLLYAVFKNQKEIVEHMLKDKHHFKLELDSVKLDISGAQPLYVRTIARRIINKTSRHAMLETLRVDPSKHDMTQIKKNLGDDLKITVREAVLNDNIAMLESVLWLGNLGDSKADTNVIKYAVNNRNCKMVEILVMEGFARPALSDSILRSKFSGDNLERARYILNPNQTRPPKLR